MPRFLLPVLLVAAAAFPQNERASFTPSRSDSSNVEKQQVTMEMRGDIAMARKMYREAIDFYAQCPKSAVISNKTGIAYHQLLDMKNAEKYYKAALKQNPNYAEAVNNLGTIYYAKKSYRRAVKQYEQALKITPTSASVYSNLGTAQFARKKYEEAFTCYQKALEIDPEVFEHRSTSGVLLQERSVEERAKFHYYLAKTYAKAGQNERALMYLRKALEEGFKERDKMAEEPDFAALRELPEFKELLTKEFKVL